jgi:biotin transport system substrate-specific component
MAGTNNFGVGEQGASGVAQLARKAALVLAGTMMIAAAGKVAVPFYPVPMTLQTLAVMLLAVAYGSRLALATVAAYLIEGALGLPVFTGTPPEAAGPLYFMGPTTGFLLGFFVLAAGIGLAADRGWLRSPARVLAVALGAEIVTFGLGFGWLAWAMPLPAGGHGIGAAAAFAGAVAPFLLSEAFKVGLVVLGVPAAARLLRR